MVFTIAGVNYVNGKRLVRVMGVMSLKTKVHKGPSIFYGGGEGGWRDLTGSSCSIWWPPSSLVIFGWYPVYKKLLEMNPPPPQKERKDEKKNKNYWMNVNQNRSFEWPKAQRTDIVCLADVAKESVFENENCERKSSKLSYCKIFTVSEGIPSEDHHGVFIWFVNMMARKCMISARLFKLYYFKTVSACP